MDKIFTPEFSTPLISHHVEHSILTITLQRPEKKNAITRDMYQGLHSALQAARKDAQVKVVIIHGSKGNFSAGNDIADFLHHPPSDESSPVLQFLKTISEFNKPLIAAADGVAVGVGTTLLLHCDLVVLNENTRLKLPFVELGLCPEAASSLLLPRIIGSQRAAQMILLSEMISAKEAFEWGLANKITTESSLISAMDYAHKMAKLPTESLILSKSLLKSETKESVSERLTLEAGHFVERLQGKDAKEAFTAFLEKRPPQFN